MAASKVNQALKNYEIIAAKIRKIAEIDGDDDTFRDVLLICIAGQVEAAHDVARRRVLPPLPSGWVDALGKERILKILDAVGDDGHGIYVEKKLADVEAPEEVLQHFVKVFASEPYPKTIITNNDGHVVSHMTGVYGLDIIQAIANSMSIHSEKMGRGYAARDLTKKIKEKLNEVNV
jgi:hypothetical protein